jgi:two-component system, NarL family, sensor histidine kinase UhpB
LRILVVEDSEEDTFLLLRQLQRAGFEPISERVASAADMNAALDRQDWDVVVSDYVLPGFGGLEALALFKQRGLDAPFIVVSGHIGEDLAVATMRAGADDYLMKDRLARLGPAIRRGLEQAEIRRAHRRSNEALTASEERFRQLAENIGAAFFMFERPENGAPGAPSYVSPAYETMWGAPCQTLFEDARSWLAAIHPDDRRRVEERLNQMAAGKFNEEFRIIRNDEQVRWINLKTFPVHDQEGRVYRVAALAEDTTERKHAEQQLRDSNDQLSLARAELEKRVQERTADLSAANRELQNQMSERKRLENELLEIAENERRRIGFDLHDDIGQKLMGVSLLLKAVETKLANKRLEEAEDTRKIQALLDQVVNHTHDLAHCFSSLNSQGDDLIVLLSNLVANVKRTFDINCRLRATKPFPVLPQELTLQLYKIAQESISNAIKHGKARRIQVSLLNSDGPLVLQIKNDGTPFPVDCEPSNRLGLRIMNYRARTISGELEIRANGKSGTVVTCTIPTVNGRPTIELGNKNLETKGRNGSQMAALNHDERHEASAPAPR